VPVSNKRLLEFDPFSRISTFHEYDHETKVTTLTTTCDVAPILEQNKREYNDVDQKKIGLKAEMLKVASIPMAVIEKWRIEDGIDVFNKNHAGAVERKLNDPEWRFLRTAPGRVKM
jgi:hypothetical protein